MLFYLFLWFIIAKSLWGIIDPTLGGQTDCYMSSITTDFAASVVYLLMRGVSLFSLTFSLYADKAGLHSWNVGLIAVVAIVWTVVTKVTFIDSIDDDMKDSCFRGAMISMWGSTVWIVAAFVAIVIDERMADSGSAGENQPLNV